jgi:hypothetical protein
VAGHFSATDQVLGKPELVFESRRLLLLKRVSTLVPFHPHGSWVFPVPALRLSWIPAAAYAITQMLQPSSVTGKFCTCIFRSMSACPKQISNSSAVPSAAHNLVVDDMYKFGPVHRRGSATLRSLAERRATMGADVENGVKPHANAEHVRGQAAHHGDELLAGRHMVSAAVEGLLRHAPPRIPAHYL